MGGWSEDEREREKLFAILLSLHPDAHRCNDCLDLATYRNRWGCRRADREMENDV